MSELTDRVLLAKNALMHALGDNAAMYLNSMKLWFRHKCSKEEYDLEARKLMTPETIHLHNQFLIAILNKIDAFHKPKHGGHEEQQSSTNRSGSGGVNTSGGGGSSSSSSRKRKRTSRSYFDRVAFEPYDCLDFIVEDNLKIIRPPSGADAKAMPTPRYCVQEFFLPDAGFVMGRFLIGAWEECLQNVEDSVAECVAMAVQVLLKNLIAAILMKQKHYKITGEGAFYYDIGAPLRDPQLRNTVTRQKIDDGPLELDKEITSPNFMRRSNDEAIFLSACEEVVPTRRKLITLKDCQRAFTDRNLIASHAVYSINMERITQMMH